ncbi:MAG TPA: hypothetical protein VNP98_12725 [Chthoniobacterales bacterium]|nr:hypothetical protein [Chthoniobacterales bacterium]
MKTEPGAPAFPKNGDEPNLVGLTKREYFAIRMAEGLLSAGDKGTNSVAGRAVRYADELIEVLQQRQQPVAAGDQL